MSEQEIKAKIKELQDEEKNCKGTPCEVYSRVCGYLRPTAAWNKGKQEEFSLRKTFNVAAAKCS